MLIASPIRVLSLLRRLCGPRDPLLRGCPRLVRACGACAHEFNCVGGDRASVIAGLDRSWRPPRRGRDGSNYDGHRQRWREARRRSGHVMKHCEPAATGQQIYGGTFIPPTSTARQYRVPSARHSSRLATRPWLNRSSPATAIS
jgi:hypothetical protein